MTVTNFKAKNCVVAVKTEVTKGTDPTPDATNCIPCIESEWDFGGDDLRNEEMHEGSQVKPGGGIGNPFVNIKLKVYLRGSGTDAGGGVPNVPTFGPLWLASRMKYSAGVYSPDWDSESTVTVYQNWGGKLYRANCCRFNCVLNANAGQYITLDFTGMGIYVEPSEAAIFDDTDSAAAKIIAKAAAFSLGDMTSTQMKSPDFSLDFGNQLELDMNVNAATGVEEIVPIDEREPVLTCSPRILSTADGVNLYADRVAGASYAFSFTCGATALNIFTIAGTCEPVTIPMGDRAGRLTHEGATFRPISNTTDGDFTITLS